jgi:type VI secretion system protein ImpH
MFSTRGRSNTTLVDALYSRPDQFNFFQAVRLLDWTYYRSEKRKLAQQFSPVGYDRPAEKEIVRFRPIASLQFPASQITRLVRQSLASEKEMPPEMMVTFMGLTGPSGVLPVHYTRELLNRIHDKDTVMRDFLDLFNHRIISFYYRSWEKYRFYINYEFTRQRKKEDKFTKILRSLVGLGTPGMQKRLPFSDERILFYAGLFSNSSRNASGLAAILSDYFAVPVRIKQFISQKTYLPVRQQTRLPDSNMERGQYHQLGRTAILGGSVVQSQHRFRIIVGPLRYPQFKNFLPNAKLLKSLEEMVSLYVGQQYSFDVQLILKNEDYPGCRLWSPTQAEPGRLGWNMWLGAPQEAILDDLILSF